MTILCFDYDSICFRAAAATETRSIKVIKKATQEEFRFDTRSDFYGRDRKKSGGWLSLQKGLSLEDFEIQDVVEPAPVFVCLKNVDSMIAGILQKFEAKEYFGYIGGSGNFRKEICTLLPYKGNRTETILPVHLEAARRHVISNHAAIVVTGKEADDKVAEEAYDAYKSKTNLIGVGLDKDYMGCEGTWYNFVTDKLVKVEGFGSLERIQKADKSYEIKGTGRIWKYYQVCQGDASDNYDPACFCDVKNGPLKCYNALKDCKTDKEAFEAMKLHFLSLYPEPKEVTNWKGDTFTIDWLYVMQEMFDMAHMQRWDNDRVVVRDVMERLGVDV